MCVPRGWGAHGPVLPFQRPVGLEPWLKLTARYRNRGLEGFVSPTIFRAKGLRFFFFSREEDRMHVHVSGQGGECKIWLEPQIELARHHGLGFPSLATALTLTEEREDEIRRAWREHFGR